MPMLAKVESMSFHRGFIVGGIVLVATMSMVACGGGGGGGGGAINPPPTPTPSLCPSPPSGPTYPPAECMQFALGGTSSLTVTRTQPTPTPPPSMTNDTLTESVIVHNKRSFHGTTATDYVSTEADAGPHQTITTTSDNYFVFPPSTGGAITNIGFHSTDSNGVVLDVRNLSGNGQVGKIPLTTGWSNNAAQSISETDPDGTTISTTVNPDGSYSTAESEVAGPTNILQKSDGTANEIFPGDPFGLSGGALPTEISIEPVSAGNVTIDACSAATGAKDAVPCATPAPLTVTISAWYATPVMLASDTTTIAGSTSTPSGCTAFPGTDTQLHEVKSRLDTILGYSESETIDTWVDPANGPVCEQIADTVLTYYDFSGQTSGAFAVSSSPIETDAFAETLGLQSVTLSAMRHALVAGRPSGAITTAPSMLAPQMALAAARVERFRQAYRRHQLQRMHDLFMRAHIILRRGNIQ